MSILVRIAKDQSFWIDLLGSRFLVNPLSGTEESQLNKKCTEWKNGTPFFDKAKYEKEKFIKTVLDWKNVSDVDHNEVKYSEEIKEVFAELNPNFVSAINKKADFHDVARKEEEYENLGE